MLLPGSGAVPFRRRVVFYEDTTYVYPYPGDGSSCCSRLGMKSPFLCWQAFVSFG